MHIVEEFPRSFVIETSGKSLKTPFFVPAISSLAKTNWKVFEYLDLLKKIAYPGFLLSAYDIDKLENKKKEVLLKGLSDFTENMVFLDNGNYEAYWYKDKKWGFKNLNAILEKTSPDFCFSFDVFWHQNNRVERHIKETLTSIAKTASIQKTGETIALIHSRREMFPRVVRKVVDYINPEIVALPERELGSSLFERSHTIKAIRNELDKAQKPILMHLLGTGHPISILVYTLCGADMYDALLWCTHCVDPETGHLFHFSQRDLINCRCEACRLEKVPYEFQTITHNLVFFIRFLDEIRNSIKNGKVDDILEKYLRGKNVSKVKGIMGSNE